MKHSERNILHHIRRVFGADVLHLEDEELVDLIRRGVRKAAHYRIVLEHHVALFVDLMIHVDPDFDKHPDTVWARRILEDTRLSPSARMKTLFGRFRSWVPGNEVPDR